MRRTLSQLASGCWPLPIVLIAVACEPVTGLFAPPARVAQAPSLERLAVPESTPSRLERLTASDPTTQPVGAPQLPADPRPLAAPQASGAPQPPTVAATPPLPPATTASTATGALPTTSPAAQATPAPITPAAVPQPRLTLPTAATPNVTAPPPVTTTTAASPQPPTVPPPAPAASAPATLSPATPPAAPSSPPPTTAAALPARPAPPPPAAPMMTPEQFAQNRAMLSANPTARLLTINQCARNMYERPRPDAAALTAAMGVSLQEMPLLVCQRLIDKIANGGLTYDDILVWNGNRQDSAAMDRIIGILRGA